MLFFCLGAQIQKHVANDKFKILLFNKMDSMLPYMTVQ